jgi:predicted AlkP superfamily pyrophosphatase or phosphodiesterase
MSNGTHIFAPTTILISLDGFRADFLNRNLTPTLNQFVQEGISPKYMLPSFPSVTFPNHYTMATGLYPEAHGIVGNTFFDPMLKKEFHSTDPDRSLQSHWWGGEPLWVTAEKQKVRTAIHMWPGSEANILDQEIAYVDKYNGSELLSRKVDRIMALLDVPGPKDIGAKVDSPRPQFIAAYVPDVDRDGHRYGPNSTEIRKTISNADAMLGSILAGLHARNLTDIVNVVVVSDHGMATTDISRLIQLEDLIDTSDFLRTDGWPLTGLTPNDPSAVQHLYKQLKNQTADNPNVDVYLRDENMPERYHFSKNDRIAPLWIIPKTGWIVVNKEEFDIEEGKKNGDVYHPRGLHGYDHEHPLMRAIFIARGPAFPHTPGSRMEPFRKLHFPTPMPSRKKERKNKFTNTLQKENIELYNILCDSLHITPASNNGTLRLPLKPVGLHNDTEAAGNETPDDPPVSSSSLSSLSSSSPSSSSSSSSILAAMPSDLGSLSSIAAEASGLDDEQDWESESVTTSMAPSETSAAAKPDGGKEGEESWWEWLTHKADEVEDWVEGFVEEHTGKDGKHGKNE